MDGFAFVELEVNASAVGFALQVTKKYLHAALAARRSLAVHCRPRNKLRGFCSLDFAENSLGHSIHGCIPETVRFLVRNGRLALGIRRQPVALVKVVDLNTVNNRCPWRLSRQYRLPVQI